MPYIAVPEHVELTPFVENHIKVDAGTNWNIGNAGVATPIVKLPEPEIVVDYAAPSLEGRLKYPAGAELPLADPVASVTFKKNSFHNQAGVKAAVSALVKKGHTGWVVVGNSNSEERNSERLGQRRAQAVADEILKQAKGPVRVEYYGPADTVGYGVPYTVNIFVDE